MQQELKFFAENRYVIESLRTENEIIVFFAKNKIFIDKNFLNKLKLKYNNINNSTKLNSAQLESVAGGGPTRHGGIKRLHSELSSPETPLLPNPGNGTQSAPGSPVHNIFNDRNQRMLVSPISHEECDTTRVPQPDAKRRHAEIEFTNHEESGFNSGSVPSTPKGQGISENFIPLVRQNGSKVSSSLNRKAGDQGVHRNFDMIISSTPLNEGQERFEFEVHLPRKTVSTCDILGSSNPQATPLGGPSTPKMQVISTRTAPGAPIHGLNDSRITPPTTPMPQPTDLSLPDSKVISVGTPLNMGHTNSSTGTITFNKQTSKNIERKDQSLQPPPTDRETHSPITDSSAASSSPEVQSGSNSSSQAASPLAAVANFVQENRENIDPTLPEDVVLSQPAQLNTDAAYVFQPMQPSEAVMSILPENIDESIDTHDDQTDYRFLFETPLFNEGNRSYYLNEKGEKIYITPKQEQIMKDVMSGRNTLDPKTGRLTGKMDKTFMPQLCGC